jgi:hypothetical protein
MRSRYRFTPQQPLAVDLQPPDETIEEDDFESMNLPPWNATRARNQFVALQLHEARAAEAAVAPYVQHAAEQGEEENEEETDMPPSPTDSAVTPADLAELFHRPKLVSATPDAAAIAADAGPPGPVPAALDQGLVMSSPTVATSAHEPATSRPESAPPISSQLAAPTAAEATSEPGPVTQGASVDAALLQEQVRKATADIQAAMDRAADLQRTLGAMKAPRIT